MDSAVTTISPDSIECRSAGTTMCAKRCGAEPPSDSAASSSARRPSRCMSATTVCRKYGRQSTMCPAISSQMLPSQGSVSEEKTRMKPKASTSGGNATGSWYSTRAAARTFALCVRYTA